MAIQFDQTVCTISASKEGKSMLCTRSVFIAMKKLCDTQLFTCGIRKSIVRLKMAVFFALSVKVVLMKSTENEGIVTKATVKF